MAKKSTSDAPFFNFFGILISILRLDFVFKSLDDTGKSIFKTLFDEYNREYKFTGKV